MFPKKIKDSDFKKFLFENRILIISPLLIFAIIFTSFMSRNASGVSLRALIAYAIIFIGGLILLIKNQILMNIMIIAALIFIVYLYLFSFI